MSRPFEAVHTIAEWYDGPRAGAADYDGAPHWYRSVYLDTAEWSPDEDRFELTPLTPEALAWEREHTEIFERWDAARRAGTILWEDDETFGALPEEMDRYHDLARLLEEYLAEHKPVVLVRGVFEMGARRVRWEPLHLLRMSTPPRSEVPEPDDAATLEHVEELERRLEEHRADPASAIPCEQARQSLRERFGA